MLAVDSQTGTMFWLMKGELLEAERVHSIVGAFFTVYNYLWYGLSEAIYAGALEYELIDRGHEVVRELLVAVSYQGRHVGWQSVCSCTSAHTRRFTGLLTSPNDPAI
jgi:hypothetical protein